MRLSKPCFLVFCVVFLNSLYLVCNQTTESAMMNQQHGRNVIVVEVAIVCDKDLSEMFGFNRTKIVDFWKALFWDMNSRFKTLPSISVSFQVTSITTFNSTEEQSFIEEARTEDGKIAIKSLHRPFRGWILMNKWRLPKFDMAIGVTGAAYAEDGVGMASRGGACGHYNTIVLSIRCASPVAVVAHEIAHSLDAYHDAKGYDEDDVDCFPSNPSRFVMYPQVQPHARHFFSSCSDKAIARFVNTPEANCLRKLNANPQDVIFDTSQFTASVSNSSVLLAMSEQCRIITNSSTAHVKSDKASCQSGRCTFWADGVKKDDDFSPFDGSQCGNNGRCFRGKCLQGIGVQLANVACGRCLISPNTFLARSLPEMQSCPETGITPLELLFIRNGDALGASKRISTPYSSPEDNGRGNKCLKIRAKPNKPSAEEEEFILSFDKCPEMGYRVNEFGWNFVKLDDDDDGIGKPEKTGKFLLFHLQTKMCIGTMEQDSKPFLLANCEIAKTDFRFQWKLIFENSTTVEIFEDVIHSRAVHQHQTMTFFHLLLLLLLFRYSRWC